MSTDARKRAIRAYAAEHGLSYTAAMRALDAATPGLPRFEAPTVVFFTTAHDTPAEWEAALIAALTPFGDPASPEARTPVLALAGALPDWTHPDELPADDTDGVVRLGAHRDGVAAVTRAIAARQRGDGGALEPLVVVLPWHGRPVPEGTVQGWREMGRNCAVTVVGTGATGTPTALPFLRSNDTTADLLNPDTLRRPDGTVALHPLDVGPAIAATLPHSTTATTGPTPQVVYVTDVPDGAPSDPRPTRITPDDLTEGYRHLIQSRRGALTQAGVTSWADLTDDQRTTLGMPFTLVLLHTREASAPAAQALIADMTQHGPQVGVAAYQVDTQMDLLPFNPDATGPRLREYKAIAPLLLGFAHEGATRGHAVIVTDSPEKDVPSWATAMERVEVITLEQARTRYVYGPDDSLRWRGPESGPRLLVAGASLSREGVDFLMDLGRFSRAGGFTVHVPDMLAAVVGRVQAR